MDNYGIYIYMCVYIHTYIYIMYYVLYLLIIVFIYYILSFIIAFLYTDTYTLRPGHSPTYFTSPLPLCALGFLPPLQEDILACLLFCCLHMPIPCCIYRCSSMYYINEHFFRLKFPYMYVYIRRHMILCYILLPNTTYCL